MGAFWKMLEEGNHSTYGSHKWEIGKWYKKKGELVMCKIGFHCSSNISDAMHWSKDGRVLAEVEIGGNIIKDSEKMCCERMKIINTWCLNDDYLLEASKCYCSYAIKNSEKYGLRSQLERIKGYMSADTYRGFYVGHGFCDTTRHAVVHKGETDEYSTRPPKGFMYINICNENLNNLFHSETKEVIHNKTLEVLGI